MDNRKTARMELEKRDVKLQVFVTSRIDDKIEELGLIMGMNKGEIVRMAIAQYLATYDATVKMISKQINSELNKAKGDIVRS